MTQAIARPAHIRRPSGTSVVAWTALVVVLIYIVAAIFAPLLAPYGEAEIVSREPFLPWSREFLLGTDQLGRDILSRLIYGARNTLGDRARDHAACFRDRRRRLAPRQRWPAAGWTR